MAKNLAAVIPSPKAPLKIEERPIPSPGSGELLIRNHAIAANPVDWKIQAYDFIVKKYPNVLGSDVCGIVESVGPNVTLFSAGDRVCGFALSLGTQNPDEGAFQTYTILKEQAVAKLPESISFEEGALFPMGVATTASGMFMVSKLSLPDIKEESKPYEGQGAIVWGGASSVGSFAVQMLRDVGYTVFATASAQHHEYIKSLGASQVVDYKNSDVVDKIVKAAKEAGTPITYGYDAVSTGDSPFTTAEIIAQSSEGKGGKMIYTVDLQEGKEMPKGVEAKMAMAFAIFVMEEKIGRAIFNKYLPKAIARGAIKASPKVEIVEGGIEASQKAWDTLKAGVSGKKLVIKVA